jgi:hypothetical protein
MATDDIEATETPAKATAGKPLYCSFCGKSQHEVRNLVAGPSVFICDECIDLCTSIVKEQQKSANARGALASRTAARLALLRTRLHHRLRAMGTSGSEVVLWGFLTSIVILQLVTLVLLALG